MVEPVLIFFLKLRKYIGAIGLKVNSYDPCVSNKIIRNKQVKITFYAGDLKVSHADNDIVGAFTQFTKETYEDVTKLTPSGGNIRSYIYMTLDYTTSEEVKVYMK